MIFEKLQNIQNGVRYFDTATSSTSFYSWAEGGATYFSTLGADPSQYAIKINPDDTVEVSGLDGFMTLSTVQTVTAEKTFSGALKFTGLPNLVPYPYYSGSLIAVDGSGVLRTVSSLSLGYAGLGTSNVFTNSNEFSTASFKLSGLGTIIASPYYTGNLVAIDGAGTITKVSQGSLAFMTLNTSQIVTAEKTFSSADIYFTGLQTTISTGYSGNLIAIDGSGRPTKISSSSLKYVTLDTTQTVTGGKSFTSPEMYFSGLEAETTPNSGGFAILRGNKLRYCGWSTVANLLASNYVTTDTAQTITGYKHFSHASIEHIYTIGEMTNPTLFLSMDSYNNLYWTYSTNFVSRTADVSILGVKRFFGDVEFGSNYPSDTLKLWNDGEMQCRFAYNYPLTDVVNLCITAGGYIRRSLSGSSTIRVKKDVEDILPDRYNAIHNLRPVWHRYSVPTETPEEWGWYGLIAEEVHEIFPQLVQYSYDEEDWVKNKDEKPTLKEGAVRKPAGVRYDRLAVLMLPELQNLRRENDAFQKRVSDLEVIVNSLLDVVQLK
jgi:hypothetical protein